MKKLKVLLIEDHLGHRLELMHFLKRYGAEVDTAVNFFRAKDLVAKRKYDVVFSELLLSERPELQGDGIQFWKFLQSHHNDVPVYLLADEGLRETAEMLMAGMRCPHIFTKPLDAEQIREIVEREVENFKLHVAS